jgi:hypothetical protein
MMSVWDVQQLLLLLVHRKFEQQSQHSPVSTPQLMRTAGLIGIETLT